MRITAFGGDLTVSFDLNTVQPGILRLIPGITEDEISRWLTERAARAFAAPDDFRARQILGAAKLATLRFADQPRVP